MKNVILIAALAITTLLANAQNKIANPAPKGIMVYLGVKIPNGVKVNSIKIERKSDKENYKRLVEVKAPVADSDFKAKAKDYKKYFPDYTFPSDSMLSAMWVRAVKYGLVDSLGYWGLHPAVRMALGMMYYDLEANEQTVYTYKVSLQGNTNEENTSDAVSYPYHPVYEAPYLYQYEKLKEGLYIKWASVGNNAPDGFKVYRYADTKTPEEVTGTHTKYTTKDTTFYYVLDKNVTAGKVYQYSLVGVDKFGNTSYGSNPIIINLTDFSTVFFPALKADGEKDRLGVNLKWRISDIRNVASVHIFRSEDFINGFEEIAATRAADSTYTDEKISPNKIYYYYLQVKDKTGTQTKNSAKFFDYGFDNKKPLTPIVNGAVALTNGIMLDVTLTDVNIAGYRVYRSENGSSDFTVVADLVPAPKDSMHSFYYDTVNLNGKTFYNYYVQSENTSHLVSDKSNTVQTRPNIPVQAPAPTGFTFYYQDSAINLFWKDMKNDDWTVAGYKLYKKEITAKDFQLIFGKDSVYPGTRFTDYNYTAGKAYDYEVQTVDIFGNVSTMRAMAMVQVPAQQVVTPAGITAFNLPDGIRIEWGAPIMDGLKGYKLYRYQRGNDAELIANINAGTNFYLDKTAKAGQLYFYTLTAVDNSNNESAETDEVGVRH